MIVLALPTCALQAPAPASAGDAWRELDASIAALAQGDAASGRTFGGLVRAFVASADDDVTSGGDDVSGFDLEDVDVFFELEEEQFSVRVSAELDDGNLGLEDGYARYRYSQALQLAVGQFKPRVVRSGSVQPGGLLFRERTFLGALFDVWDLGAELGGHYDQFDYWLAVTNAENGSESDHFWSVRGEWTLYEDPWADVEGAHGAPNYLRSLLGAFLFGDVALSSSDGGGYGVDFALTFGPYSFHAEWAHVDDAFVRPADVTVGPPLVLGGDASPLSATISRCLGTDWEGALRWQEADDADDTSGWSAAIDWFPGDGPLRWIADATRIEDDLDEGWILSLGIAIGASSAHGRPFSDP